MRSDVDALKTAGLLLMACLALQPGLAHAYVGPGLGVGAVAAVLGSVFGVLMLLVGVVWYPLKRVVGRFRRSHGA